ncbi:hypothetical protein AKJ16_DCAP17084 [Drosera capensis]
MIPIPCTCCTADGNSTGHYYPRTNFPSVVSVVFILHPNSQSLSRQFFRSTPVASPDASITAATTATSAVNFSKNV